ncbi:MAG TPA: glycosyltransferase [Verrucomicrobiota bacterium]|nr:glycosyltransferase [Verrucomicrobiota bacterium]
MLILTASFGDGHNAAARSVREAIELLDDSAAVEVLDLLDAAYGRLNTLARQTYLGLVRYTPALWGGVYHLLDAAPEFMTGGGWTRLRKALAEVIEQSRPDVVVSTYPVYGQAVRELYQDHADRGFRFCTIVTDSITVNAAWHRAPSDRFFVANDETAAVMRQAGVSPDLIEVTGFPVNPIFAPENVPDLEPPAAGRPARVLFIINTGRAKIGKTFDRLLEDPRVHLTVTAGRDPELKAKLVERVKPYGGRVAVLGWTKQKPRLLMTHHLVITKAGGATVQEAIAARCPLIINQTIPGQEEGNARLVEQGGFGVVAEGKRETVEAVRDALAKDARRWLRWRENITRVSRPDAAFRIAEQLLEDGDQPGRWRKTIPLFTPTRRPSPPPAARPSANAKCS